MADGKGKQLTNSRIIGEYLEIANYDKDLARKMAKADGWVF